MSSCNPTRPFAAALFFALTMWTVPGLARPAASRPLPTAQPSEVQLDAARLDQAAGLVREAVERNELRGAVLLVARRGRIVLHEAIGHADFVEQRAMRLDSVFHVASNTKPVVAAAALQLAAEGRLELDADIGRYLSEFDRESYAGVTMRRLLSHTSGLRIGPIFLEPLSPRSDALLHGPTLRSEANRFATIPVAVKPGTSFSYNNAGYNVAGAVLEQAAGQTLDQLLIERLYQPLAMHSTAHVDNEVLGPRRPAIEQRLLGNWIRLWKPGDPPKYPFVRASGGMLTTAADYASFLQMFLDRGRVGEHVVLPFASLRQALRAETRELATNRSPSGGEPARSTAAATPPTYYGLGWQVGDDGVCAHSGSDGTYAWFDPHRDLLGVFFTQNPGGILPFAAFRQRVEAACTDPLPARSRVVAHRGLLREYPENTLVNFRECMERGYGFEFDVRRTRDGRLVCLHDDDLRRTTGESGRVADRTLAEIKQLDAGGWFAPQFRGERVPTIDEVFQLVARFHSPRSHIAVDLKQDDERVEKDVLALAQKHGVLDRLVMIGRTIDHPEVRERLWKANDKVACARLAQSPADLNAVLGDTRSSWAYLRFVPTKEQRERLHAAGKKIFVAGPLFASQQHENWRASIQQGVDAILTDDADELHQLQQEQ